MENTDLLQEVNTFCKGCRLIKDNMCIMYNISIIDELDFDCSNRYYENDLLNIRIEDETNEGLEL